ncbi:probable disease resistance protein At1g58602 [Amaranthus tricolor]|uniref:probable disease resistance protein At1g58602 n=1 Tax=Amaranthus tricolor TaxID=29722 RepID=UPI002590480F|nr:probable disease resistance protein At1g58602 [Amaranthus tricolor]
MTSSSIESAAQWLGKLLVQEVQYLAAVRDKVEDLQSELEWMQCFLWDADEKQNKNALLRKWVFEIKESALEAEDLIELYILGIARKRENNGFWIWDDVKWLACCWMEAMKLHYIGSDIDALTAKICKMSSRLQTYGVKSSYDKYSSRAVLDKKMIAEQRRTYSHICDRDVVGLEESIADLADRLKENGKHGIVALHGMGGIGKTTLAREVFHYTPLKDIFDGFAWAYISQQLQLGPVCREILLQLIPEKNKEERKLIEGLQDSQLPGKLCDMLKQKKYLVVLDDVWFSRDWKCLEPAFPVGDTSNGSKLLVTTRNPQIFSGLSDDLVSYHQVHVLDRDKSWKLLQNKSNFEKEKADPIMVELGNKMLDHCNGHPLAIVILGGVLATKKSVEEWQYISDTLPSHLQGDESYSGVYEVLAMSYYELPYTIKPCFLHLGNFPEDYEIPVQRLYHLWIAEGIVTSTQDKVAANRSLDDISDVCLNELVHKGMIQMGSIDSDGKICTCRIHDLMRDKCLDINNEENFLQIFDYRSCNREDQQHQAFINAPHDKLRRMTLYFDERISLPLPIMTPRKVSSLRSLVFFPSDDSNEEDCRWIIAICKGSPLLRILDFEGVRLQGSLPKEVGYLIYLRYLSLKGTCITKLPTSIGNLRSLMILDLRVNDVNIMLPNQLWKMKSLRHLYFPSRILSQENVHQQGYTIEEDNMLKLDQLGYLEKLEDVDLDRVDVNGLVELRSMRKLSASCVSKKESLVPFLKSTSIKSLSLKVHADIINQDHMILSTCASLKVLHIDAERYPRTYLPMTLDIFPQNLVELGFWYCKFSEDPMPILEKLPKLRNLQLHICYDKSKLACSNKGFPELTYLALDGLFSTNEWTVEKGGLPKLKNVEIYNCPLTKLPDVLPSHISIVCCPCISGIKRHGSCHYFKA